MQNLERTIAHLNSFVTERQFCKGLSQEEIEVLAMLKAASSLIRKAEAKLAEIEFRKEAVK